MKPTNNGNCKNGDSGHHYWRRCNNRFSRVSWKSALQDDSFRSRFLNKITGKIFQNFELYFLNFFFICESMKNSTEKNDWTALRPETNFVELTTPTLWIQIPEKVWKKKKNPPIGTWAAILEFFDLFTHFGNHTGSQRKKLHFPCQSLSFYYPLI